MNGQNNEGYFQNVPIQQPVVFQQPQNIYQQLGKPQPQPHLQGHPNYAQQQQQSPHSSGFQQQHQQRPQSSGFQFSQPAQQPTSYAVAQTSFLPHQTQYQQPSYIPQQTPYIQQQVQYSPGQPGQQQQQQPQFQVPGGYTPNVQYQVQPQPQQFAVQQQQQFELQQQVVQYQPQQAIQQQLQQVSYQVPQQAQFQQPQPPPPQPSPINLSSSTSSNHSLTASQTPSWRRVSPKPPPVALSASLAQSIPPTSSFPRPGPPFSNQQQPSPPQISPSHTRAQSVPSPSRPQIQTQGIVPSINSHQQGTSQFNSQAQPTHSRPLSQGRPTAAQLAQMGQPPTPAVAPATTPTTPGPTRRPLPQPAGNAAPLPSVPPARSQTLPTPTGSGIGKVMSPAVANAIAQLQRQTPGLQQEHNLPSLQTNLPAATSTQAPSSPTKRPLPKPAPAEEKEPKAVSDTKTGASATGSGTAFNIPRRPVHGASTVVPSLSSSPTKSSAGVLTSRTSSYALGNSSTSNATTTSSSSQKRRVSPPRFPLGTGRTSPTKSSSVESLWGAHVLRAAGVGPPETEEEARRAEEAAAALAAAAAAAAAPAPEPRASTNSPNKPVLSRPALPTTSSSMSTASTSTAVSTASASSSSTTKNFTPMWRRTIPEMPAPAWGYAAGMVAEPHPKPAPAPVTTALTPKERKKREKEEKERVKEEKRLAKQREKEVRAAEKLKKKGGKAPVGVQTGHGTPYAFAQQPHAPAPSAVQARYGAYQQQMQLAQQQRMIQQQQQQMQALQQYSHMRTPAGYRQPQTQAETDDDEEEEEDEEEDEDEESEESEEDDEEEEEEEEEEQPVRHSRTKHYTQPLRASSPDQSRYDASPSLKKKSSAGGGVVVLRPKSVVDTSPIGGTKGRRRAGSDGAVMRMRHEYEDSHDYGSAYERVQGKAKLSPSPNSKPKLRPKRDEERDRTPTKRRVVPRSESVGPPSNAHARSRSAFEERDREPVMRYREEPEERGVARRRPASAFAHRRPRKYEDEYDDDESVHLAYDDEEEEEDYDNDRGEERWDRTPRKRAAAGPGRPASPPYGIRNLPPAKNRRQAYEDDYEYEEEERRPARRPHTAGAERQTAHIVRGGISRGDWDNEPRRGNAGLPQPPAMVRRDVNASVDPSPDKAVRDGPRTRSVPLKVEDDQDYLENDRRYIGRANVQAKTSTMRISGGGNETAYERGDSRMTSGAASSSNGPWPTDLPRLPRTPGSGNTPQPVREDAGGYFDNRQSLPHTNSNQPQGRPTTSTATFHNRASKATLNRASLDLDDPPPQASIVRTPSPGPQGGYVFTPRRELPQPQGAPQGRGNAAEDNARVAADLQRRRSLYSVASSPGQREQPQPQPTNAPKRPQSQIYQLAAAQHQSQRSIQMQQAQQQQQQQQHPQQHPQHPQQLQQQQQQRPPPQQQQHLQQQHSLQYSNPVGGNRPQGHGPRAPSSRPQQTPAPPQPLGIESPHPIGGREKRADIVKLEEESNEGSDTEHVAHRHANASPVNNVPMININGPPPSVPAINVNAPSIPTINVHEDLRSGPMITVDPPMIRVDEGNDNAPRKQVFEIPGVSVSGPEFNDNFGGPSINISGPEDVSPSRGGHTHGHVQGGHHQQVQQHRPPSQFGQPRTGGLICGGCGGPIIGRIVSAMGQRYHPNCFKCTVCNELLEHVSSYEHEGKPYCHLDYHESFAPRCYSCKTAIIEEQFISLDDPALGKRTYHTQHFFCSECGDPFLTASGGLDADSKGEFAVSGDGEFEGFTVYKGYPYCEACHVRLRLPKCKRCKRSIRDSDQAVEALGGKWCWGCFVCAGCENPFDDPSFFQRGDQPYCERCFSIILRNEV